MHMEYTLAIENTPESVPGGTGILLVHPSTVETDRIDTEFLKTDTDNLLIVSTRTTAREVKQKLEHYEVDESRATILDALSAERGYTRRQSDSVHYLPAANDLDGIVEETSEFLDTHGGKRRVSIDSITEMIYYADEEATHEAVEALLDLLVQHDAVGIFHLAAGVHDEELVSQFRGLFEGVVELDEGGTISSSF
jgi:KaiC/GvpD/RAD55 family RecA-like ATPase